MKGPLSTFTIYWEPVSWQGWRDRIGTSCRQRCKEKRFQQQQQRPARNPSRSELEALEALGVVKTLRYRFNINNTQLDIIVSNEAWFIVARSWVQQTINDQKTNADMLLLKVTSCSFWGLVVGGWWNKFCSPRICWTNIWHEALRKCAFRAGLSGRWQVDAWTTCSTIRQEQPPQPKLLLLLVLLLLTSTTSTSTSTSTTTTTTTTTLKRTHIHQF